MVLKNLVEVSEIDRLRHISLYRYAESDVFFIIFHRADQLNYVKCIVDRLWPMTSIAIV